MVQVPNDRDLEKLTWVTNTKVQPNRIIFCKNCPGIIMFNLEEILDCKSRGTNTSTPCKYCNYHPGFPPEPYIVFDGRLQKDTREQRMEFSQN